MCTLYRWLIDTSLSFVLLLTASASYAQFDPRDYSYEVVMQSEHYIFDVEIVAEGLIYPWSIAFLPNGDMLITERSGRLRIVRNGVLDPDPIPGVPEVWFRGRGGFLDVRLHPDFESNQLVYFTYTKPNETATHGAMAMARGRFDGQRLTEVEDIFVAHPYVDRAGHLGSRLAFDKEGYIYMSTGDLSMVIPTDIPREEHPSQDLSNHAGTIVRLHDDGRVPSDNPFVNTPGALPEIWSYGHRNVQGLAVDPESGELWATEHGPHGGDELNHILRGRNYGWPVIGYGIMSDGTGTPIHENTMQEGMETPVDFWLPSIAPSGLMVYTGDSFPKWRGDIFVGAMRGHALHRLRRTKLTDGSYRIGRIEEPPMLQGFGRIRDVVQGPEGYVYLAIEDHVSRGRPSPIVRLKPVRELDHNPHYHPFIFR
jgi:glucose/arabinose dehydrogenase